MFIDMIHEQNEILHINIGSSTEGRIVQY